MLDYGKLEDTRRFALDAIKREEFWVEYGAQVGADLDASIGSRVLAVLFGLKKVADLEGNDILRVAIDEAAGSGQSEVGPSANSGTMYQVNHHFQVNYFSQTYAVNEFQTVTKTKGSGGNSGFCDDEEQFQVAVRAAVEVISISLDS